MPTTIHIQGRFSYGLLPLLILFIVLLVSFIKMVKNRAVKAIEEEEALEAQPQIKPMPLSVKETYVNHLEGILDDYRIKKRGSRESYQLLSFFIREFVNEYTGVDVRKKTLAEIRGLKFPVLEKLIEEYYAFEFAPDKEGDIEASIKKTIKVIEKWK